MSTDNLTASQRTGRVQVIVATTVFLSFISFWRAAAIVIGDLGSSAFYVGGIAEEAVGRSAPWFILGVMLFSYAVRAIYIESSVMFVRGGVYRVVKEALGGTLAKLSVSALLFDYVLTGPISAVSAGQYIVGLLNDVAHRAGSQLVLPRDATAAVLAAIVIVYFWWRNTQGLHESSRDALHIAQITGVMVILLLLWAAVTLLRRGGPLPPLPSAGTMTFSNDALGWLRGTRWPSFTLIAVMVGLGHSFLAMSGWESLAQVYREIESPKIANLKKAGAIIFAFSVTFTASVSFLAVAMIPDDVRSKFYDNLISGITMHLAGPLELRLLFQGFVVLVGFLILASAVNTAIVGSNAVVNRVSEDGVLTEWFRKPHRRFGTTYRILNTIVVLQLITLVLSGGNVYVLGEAYAFGVIWSFAFKALAVLVLRFRQPGKREWRVPFNVTIGGTEVPIGLALITLALFTIALVNLATKELATISGLAFTAVLYTAFVTSEHRTAARHRREGHTASMDQFQLLRAEDDALSDLGARPGCVLVPVRDYNTLAHLKWVLTHTSTAERDIVAMTVRVLTGPDTGFKDLRSERLFTDYEQLLFTRVVSAAEREGRPVKLLVVPSSNVPDAIAQTAYKLQASEIVVGESAKVTGSLQAKQLGEAWEKIPGSGALQTRVLTFRALGAISTYQLGPHAPALTADDLDLIHHMWLQAVGRLGPGVHHRDVVRAALEEFASAMEKGDGDEAVSKIEQQALGRR